MSKNHKFRCWEWVAEMVDGGGDIVANYYHDTAAGLLNQVTRVIPDPGHHWDLSLCLRVHSCHPVTGTPLDELVREYWQIDARTLDLPVNECGDDIPKYLRKQWDVARRAIGARPVAKDTDERIEWED